MKIKCDQCGEVFDVPADKKITLAHCPFCDHGCSTKKQQTQVRAPTKGYADPLAAIRPKQSHPLSTQMTIIASCVVFITGLIIFLLIASTAKRYKQEQEAEEFLNELTNKFENTYQTMNKINGTMATFTTNMMKPFMPKSFKQP